MIFYNVQAKSLYQQGFDNEMVNNYVKEQIDRKKAGEDYLGETSFIYCLKNRLLLNDMEILPDLRTYLDKMLSEQSEKDVKTILTAYFISVFKSSLLADDLKEFILSEVASIKKNTPMPEIQPGYSLKVEHSLKISDYEFYEQSKEIDTNLLVSFDVKLVN